MMFKFRLEPVLKYRSRIVEKFQRELAVVNNVLQKESDKLEILRSNQKSNSEEYCNQLRKLTLEDMVLYDKYFNGIVVEIEKQKQVIDEIQKKVDEKRATLIESVKQKKIIETVKKRDLMEYSKIEKKKEDAFLDEVSVIRFKR